MSVSLAGARSATATRSAAGASSVRSSARLPDRRLPRPIPLPLSPHV
ncbi:Uncharacterised protein [Mycobacteroides abscessus]|nr:Uncharacterised protein [Mycobacteroides abscessus]